MAGNTFGKAFRVTTFGESHGVALGVIVDGCPAGLELSEDDIQRELDKRRPGISKIVSQRKERDRVKILSGVFQGKTLGTPICMVIYNEDVDSRPYESIRYKPRPNHADLTYFLKYKHYDYRGGGRASGRETVARVAAGAIAKKLLSKYGIKIIAYTLEIYGIRASIPKDVIEIERNIEKNPVRCPDLEAAKKMQEEIERAMNEGDSLGGIVEVQIINVPPGLGEPVFDKLEADLAKAIMSIGAVKGVEFGLGFEFSRKKGSEVLDEFYLEGNRIRTYTNYSGGILGGISNGMPIIIRAVVKPTPSIRKKKLRTVDLTSMRETEIEISGRHDPCIVPRVIPVIEAMVAITIADHMIRAGYINPCTLLNKEKKI